MLDEPKRFEKCAGGYRVGFSRGEMEWLLQVLNDVRVGSWIALGSPSQQEEAIKGLNEQNAPHLLAMELAGYFESYLLDAISGELIPNEEPSLPVILGQAIEFPDPELADADGMVAAGGDLSVERLLAAYRQGIFPWTVNPITWWSPDPRGIIELDDFHVSESLAKVIRKKPFEVTFDKAFPQVMQACATLGPKRRSTWITAEFIAAYTELHKRGHAHSVECWQDGKLVGGVYGVAIGGLFAGESMFHLVDNASKVALYHLVQHLQARVFMLFDIQMVTAATEPLGARAISRSEYLHRLAVAVQRECSF
jgi:leucyl/phenylalanyl-tRNA--protein transferase